MSQQTQDGDEELGLPIWALPNAFPPSADHYGWIDRKGHRHSCASLEKLSKQIREDDDSSISLVWTPESTSCLIPEEVEALTQPIREVRTRWAITDLASAKDRIKWLGCGVAILVSYIAFANWARLNEIQQASGLNINFIEEMKWMIGALSRSTPVGISLLAFLIFAFIPWYQAQKRHREIIRHGSRSEPVIPLIRFETWLEFQKSPVTKIILGCITVAFIGQILADQSIVVFGGSIHQAGLVKAAYQAGDYWRLLTAPMLHGGILHFVMNALALLYLGKRMEVFARWPHVPAVFIFSALMAGEATSRFTEVTSVGASGGLMGWLGFLLVFETLHRRLVPRSSTRRLVAAIILTGLMGLIGYRFIDNAAHFGGLIAGMVYAGIVFPKSSSVIRPRMNLTDRTVGIVSLGLIAFSAVFTLLKILS